MSEFELYRQYRAKQGREMQLEDWGRAYRWYLRGWLPLDYASPILDVGCGEGHLLHALQRWGYRNASGIDLRDEAVAFCRNNRIDATVGDATDYLANCTSQFKLITAIDFLEHLSIERGITFLNHARGALRPGGSLILQVPNLESPFGGGIFYGDLTHRTGFTTASLAQMLRQAGFEDVELRGAGPGIWGVLSCGRYLLWQGVNALLRICTVIECGSSESAIYTRVMFGRAQVEKRFES